MQILPALYHNGSAATAKSLQSCPTLCDPIDGSPPGAPPSLGFSRQEYWSGLPFPSPMHESEKSKWSRSVVSDSSRPHELQPTRLLCPWDLPGKSTGVGCHCLLRNSTPQHITKRIENKCLPQNLCMNVHSSTIYNIYKVEITQKSIYWGTDK